MMPLSCRSTPPRPIVVVISITTAVVARTFVAGVGVLWGRLGVGASATAAAPNLLPPALPCLPLWCSFLLLVVVLVLLFLSFLVLLEALLLGAVVVLLLLLLFSLTLCLLDDCLRGCWGAFVDVVALSTAAFTGAAAVGATAAGASMGVATATDSLDRERVRFGGEHVVALVQEVVLRTKKKNSSQIEFKGNKGNVSHVT